MVARPHPSQRIPVLPLPPLTPLCLDFPSSCPHESYRSFLGESSGGTPARPGAASKARYRLGALEKDGRDVVQDDGFSRRSHNVLTAVSVSFCVRHSVMAVASRPRSPPWRSRRPSVGIRTASPGESAKGRWSQVAPGTSPRGGPVGGSRSTVPSARRMWVIALSGVREAGAGCRVDDGVEDRGEGPGARQGPVKAVRYIPEEAGRVRVPAGVGEGRTRRPRHEPGTDTLAHGVADGHAEVSGPGGAEVVEVPAAQAG